MKFTTRPPFELTGLHIHTTWQNNQAKTDIARLWKRFYKDDIAGQLDFSVDDTVYLLYTDYHDSSNQGFSVWLGLETEIDAPLPMDMRRFKIPALNYYQFEASSEMPEDMLVLWETVHQAETQIKRSYRCDFETYPDGENAQLFISTSQE